LLTAYNAKPACLRWKAAVGGVVSVVAHDEILVLFEDEIAEIVTDAWAVVENIVAWTIRQLLATKFPYGALLW
jgi:hypothetical protein